MRHLAICIMIAVLVSVFPSKSIAKTKYLLEIKRATKRGQTYDGTTWDAKVIWYATFFDDRFRREHAERHAKINNMGPVEKQEWITEQNFIHDNRWDFFVVMYTKKDYKKFSMESDSFWEILMTTESGETIYPAAIEQIPVTPYELVMFPHIDRWSRAYRVSFPKADLGRSILLTLRSIIGKSTLAWNLNE